MFRRLRSMIFIITDDDQISDAWANLNSDGILMSILCYFYSVLLYRDSGEVEEFWFTSKVLDRSDLAVIV